MPRLSGLSFAYPDVPALARAPLVEPEMPASLRDFDVFVLSTCLRVEIAWSGGPEIAPTVLSGLYGSEDLPTPKRRSGHEAFHHLARVAAGLDSSPVGETDILAQFRQALRTFEGRARERNEMAPVLKTALGVGRAARRSLDREAKGSLAAAAASLTSSAPRVALLGNGAMARSVVEELAQAEVVVYARRPGNVGGIATRPWEELATALAGLPAVVSTVPGPISLFNGKVLGRRREPLIFVDIGMPPAFDPVGHSDLLDYRGVDDVAAGVEFVPAPDAEEVAARESLSSWQRLTVSDRAGSIITSVVGRAEQTVDEEVQRFASRLATAREPETVLRQLARSVAKRILHPSVSYVGSTPLEQGELDVVARAFGVEDD